MKSIIAIGFFLEAIQPAIDRLNCSAVPFSREYYHALCVFEVNLQSTLDVGLELLQVLIDTFRDDLRNRPRQLLSLRIHTTTTTTTILSSSDDDRNTARLRATAWEANSAYEL